MFRNAFLVSLALVLAMTAAFAQNVGNPRNTPPPRIGDAQLETTPNGIFVLSGGVLAKFDVATLKPAGVVELFGPMPAPPVLSQPLTPQDQQTLQSYSRERSKRQAPAAVLSEGDVFLIVINGAFFRVNQKTMALEAKQEDLLPKDDDMLRFYGMQKPLLQLTGKTLFVLIGTNLVSVNAENGEIGGRAPMPESMYLQMPRPMMGGGGQHTTPPGGNPPGNPPAGAPGTPGGPAGPASPGK